MLELLRMRVLDLCVVFLRSGDILASVIAARLLLEYRVGRIIPETLALVSEQRCIGSDSLRIVILDMEELLEESEFLRCWAADSVLEVSRDSCFCFWGGGGDRRRSFTNNLLLLS